MDIIIRHALDADADAISALSRDIQALHAAAMPARFKPPGQYTFPAAYIRALIPRSRYRFYVAAHAGEIVGYLYAESVRRPETPTAHPEHFVYVNHIGVAALFRRRGVGRALLDAVCEEARTYGIANLALDTWSFNEEARRFFRNYGMTPVNERLVLRD